MLGPRQIGKTTLAHDIVENYAHLSHTHLVLI